MKHLFRTKVVRTKGTPRHLISGKHVRDLMPDPVQLTIVEMEDGSIFLFRENPAGVPIADTWHETADDAKQQGELECEIAGWVPS